MTHHIQRILSFLINVDVILSLMGYLTHSERPLMWVLQCSKPVIARSQAPLVYSMLDQALGWSSPPSGSGSKVLYPELKFHI